MGRDYDIFISYRRVDSEGRTSGRDIARTIKLELEKRGYKVFFDYSEIKDNEFENVIIPAVKKSMVFILVLSKDSLLRCINKGDWVRREIETAINNQCKIIPVNPDGAFNSWPSLPEEIKYIERQQISEISMGSLFEVSIDKLVKERIGEITSPRESRFSKMHPAQKYYKWGFVASNGEVAIPCVWDNVENFYEDLAAVKDSSDKWGFINKKGNLVIPCKWGNGWPNHIHFSEGLAIVQDNSGKWIFIDKKGDVAFPCKWKNMFSFKEGIASVEDFNDRMGAINKKGELTIACEWDYVGSFHEGLAVVRKLNDDRFGVINRFGKLVIPCVWGTVHYFSEGLAAVKDKQSFLSFINPKGKYGYMNQHGDIVLPYKWSCAGSFHEGLAAVADESGKWGFINRNGEVVISCKWKSALWFSNGMAAVQNDHNFWGYIDKNGNNIIPCQWLYEPGKIECYEDGTVWVSELSDLLEETWYLIDKKGNRVT